MPEAINLAKPGTLGNAILELDSASNGPTSNSQKNSSHIKIKTEQVQISTSVQAVETTGDGDEYANYDHGSMIRVRFSITGYALSESAVQLEQMATDTAGGTEGNGDYLVKLNYHGNGSAATRQIRGRMLIENISIAYSKKSPLVALSMSGMIRRDPNTALEL